MIHKINDNNIQNIIALRGDPPEGQQKFVNYKDGYEHANELVAHIRQFEISNNYNFGIAVAGYPEKHLEAINFDEDIDNLKIKVSAGADVVITQLFFDNIHYYRYLNKINRNYIKVPIIPGLMPIISARQIKIITSMCGSTIPAKLGKELSDAENDDNKATSIGISQCVRQANDLLSRGVPGIHFYVLNHSEHITEIINQLDI
jgi:methylenetetrahydrofolate reductase (NADPH)